MIKYITLRENVTHIQVGCSPAHFSKHIQGKALRVLQEDRTNVIVKDRSDDELQHTIQKQFCQDTFGHTAFASRTITEEMTGRRVNRG